MIATTPRSCSRWPENANGENAAVIRVRNSPELFLRNPENISWRDRSQRPHESSMKFVSGKKLASARMNRNRWKQGQKEVVGELCRQAEDVVLAGFLCGPLQQFAPAEGDMEGSEHEAIECKIAPSSRFYEERSGRDQVEISPSSLLSQ